MKRLAPIIASASYLLSASYVFAVDITVNPPTNADGKPVGYRNLGDFITKSIQLIFIIAVIAMLAMLIWGALDWILSAGEKDAVAKARQKILNALIGLAVLAVAWAIAELAAQFLGFPSIRNFPIPSPA